MQGRSMVPVLKGKNTLKLEERNIITIIMNILALIRLNVIME